MIGGMKNILVVFALTLLLGACNRNAETTFELLFPSDDARKVELETVDGRMSLDFVQKDSLRVGAFRLPLKGGEYARLWVGDLPYTVWLEEGKPWTARFKWNEWHFEGKGADINRYLNKRFLHQIFFIDYYRIPNEQFRAKLQEAIAEREDSLREVALPRAFKEREKKRIVYFRNNHLASAVVYGEVKDGKMNLPEDTYAELLEAAAEDSTSWKIPEYRESINRVLTALAKIDELAGDFYDVVMNVLGRATKNYEDGRLVEYLVNRNVMDYVKAMGAVSSAEMDSIFRQWVHQSDHVAVYDDLYNRNRKLMKGQLAVPFTFKDIDGKEVSLSDLKGKYVYVDLWATWCGPCNAELPALKKLEKRLEGRNIYFVSISCDKDRATWERFVRERKLGGIQLHMGEDKHYMQEISCNGVPRFLLIDREGQFVDANMSRPSASETLEVLEGLDGL